MFDNILNRQIAADIPVGGFAGELLEQLQQILFILTEPEARGQHFKAYAVFCHRAGEIRNLLVHNIWTGHVKRAGKNWIFKAVCYQDSLAARNIMQFVAFHAVAVFDKGLIEVPESDIQNV